MDVKLKEKADEIIATHKAEPLAPLAPNLLLLLVHGLAELHDRIDLALGE